MSNEQVTYDCIIVGAGPTGAVLALLLGRAGHHVLVLERDADVFPLPRAVHMDHEIMRVLQDIGVVERMAPHSSGVDDYVFLNAAHEVLLEIKGGAELANSGYVASTMFLQPELEAILRDEITHNPGVDGRFGARALELDAGEPVAVVFEQDGNRHRAKARFLVGCDGASSFVRRALNTPMEDLGFDEPWVVVDTLVKGDTGLPANTAYQFCDPQRPTTCVPAGPGRQRWEFMLLPGESADDMGRWENVWPLLAPWGGRAVLEPVRLAVYRFHALIAQRWRRDAVLLAGDAAHQTPPFMGQGLCSGLRDAANLSWKLDLVLRDRATPSLLDTYEAERAPHFRHVVETSVAMGRIVCELDPAKAAQRDAMMKAARAAGRRGPGGAQGGQVAPLTGGLLLADDPGAGWLFPQPSGRCKGRAGRMDDLVGGGVQLVVDDRALLPPAASLAAIEANAVVLDADGFEETSAPSASDWLHQRGVHAALVRPDHYTFGTASDRAGVARLLQSFDDCCRT
jgi:3-(3-hydroxy-phenyl)propionate hydroxylase